MSVANVSQEKFALVIRVRIVAAAVSLVFFSLLRLTGVLSFPFWNFSAVPLALIFVNQPWPWLVRKTHNDRFVFFINQLFDVLLVTCGIHFLGGTNFWPMILVYPLIFIFTGTVLGSGSAYVMANISFMAYSLLVLLESSKVLPPVPVFRNALSYSEKLVQVLAILPFYNLIAYYSSSLSSALRENVERRLRAEIELRRERENLELKVKQRTEEIEKARQEIRRYAQKLEESNAGLKQFSSVVSHDLQEPLMSIRLLCEVLHARLRENLDSESNEHFQHINEAAKRLQAMVRGLLEYASFSNEDAGKPLRVNLERVLEEIVRDYQARIGQLKAKIEWGRLPNLKGEPLRIRQLFQNFISNSLKYAKPDVAPHIRISSEGRPDGSIAVSIQDNGIGFDPAQTEAVYQPFKRLAPSRARGLGLGLALCKNIADHYGWALEVRTQPGSGTCFTIVIPPEPAETGSPEESPFSDQSAGLGSLGERRKK